MGTALMITEHDARALLVAASRADVHGGGWFAATRASVSVWGDSHEDCAGQPVLFGTVHWMYDTPRRHYATIYRIEVTRGGSAAGESPTTVLEKVLALTGVTAVSTAGSTLTLPPDPFRGRRTA